MSASPPSSTMCGPTAALPLLRLIHRPDLTPHSFEVVGRSESRTEALTLPGPNEVAIEDWPGARLDEELTWYLHAYPHYPHPPEDLHARRVQEALGRWAAEVRDALSTGAGLPRGIRPEAVEIIGEDASMLGWPWEAIWGPETILCRPQVQRQPRIPAPSQEARRILLISPRPERGDISHRAIAAVLVRLARLGGALVHVVVPPTLAALKVALTQDPGWDVLHFDGHGESREGSGAAPALWFEDGLGMRHPVSAKELLDQCPKLPPLTVLNACRSARARQPGHPSLAMTLSRRTGATVVAMSHDLTVDGALVFVESFYQALFGGNRPEYAAAMARLSMNNHPHRRVDGASLQLKDWHIPQVYGGALAEHKSGSTSPAPPPLDGSPTADLEAAHRSADPGDALRLELQHSLERELAGGQGCILLHGLVGVGKTTEAGLFADWVEMVGLVSEVQWLEGSVLERLSLLESARGRQQEEGPPLLSIWDDFDLSVEAWGGPKDALRTRILRAVDEGQPLVLLLIGRARHPWLGDEVSRLPVRLLDEEEIVRHLSAKAGVPQDLLLDDQDWRATLSWMTQGHPELIAGLARRWADLKEDEDLPALLPELLGSETTAPRTSRSLGLLRSRFSPNQLPAFPPFAMSRLALRKQILTEMLRLADVPDPATAIAATLSALERLGLVNDLGEGLFELHPALSLAGEGWCAQSWPSERMKTWRRAFVEAMAAAADEMANASPEDKMLIFDELEEGMQRALSISREDNIHYEQAMLLQGLASAYDELDLDTQAAALWREMADLSASQGDWESEAAASQCLGNLELAAGRLEEAQSYYHRSLNLLPQDHWALGTIYHQLGQLARRQDRLEEASRHLKHALALKAQENDPRSVGMTLHALGSMAIESRDMDEAESNLLQALKALRSAREWGQCADVCQKMAILATHVERDAAAETWLQEAVRYAEAVGDEDRLSVILHDLGAIAQRLKHPAEARRHYLRVAKLDEDSPWPRRAAPTYYNIGWTLREEGDLPRARAWIQRCRTLVRDGEAESVLDAACEEELGLIALAEGKPTVGASHLIRCLGLLRKNDQLEHLPRVRAKLKDAFSEAGSDLRLDLERQWRLSKEPSDVPWR